MRSSPEGSEGGSLDRRAFLIGVSGAGLALATGCGGATKTSHTGTRTQATTTVNRPLPGSLEGAIRGQVIKRGDPGFTAAAHIYDPRFDDILPTAVARPIDAQDVQRAIRFTVAKGIQVRARSGGHSYAGYSTLPDGVVLDLRHMNSIRVDRRTGTATVGAGAQLIDIAAALSQAGAMLPIGSCPSVGVSGVTLGGGFGLAGRRFGLTSDNLVAARIVTADGRLRIVNGQADPELLWALKGGGGGNFGVVTEFTFNVHPL